MDLQSGDDRTGDLVLDGEDVLEVAVEALRPKMKAAGRIDQLGIDPDAIGHPPDAAFEHITYLQVLRDLPGRRRPSLVLEGRVARVTDKAESWDRSVIRSSVKPSLKYSCSGSRLRLSNGSTAIEGLSEAAAP